MPPRDLVFDEPRKGASYYLDTSALVGLAWRAAAGSDALVRLGREAAHLDKELGRAERVSRFALSARQVDASVTMTLLALEELGATVRRWARDAETRQSAYEDWKFLERSDSEEARLARQRVRETMLFFMKKAVSAASENAIEVVNASQLKKSKKAFTQLLEKVPVLDPMDALHIITAAAMRTKQFIAFDDAWTQVPGIEVYR